MADMKESLQDLTNRVDKSSKRMGLKIKAEKTKTMAVGKQHEELQVRLGTGVLEQVTRFVYLGGLITEDGRCEKDVKRRIGLACAAFGGLGKMWREKSISMATKMKLCYALVAQVLLHGTECWSLRKENEGRLLVAEMSWVRRIIGRSRREKVRMNKQEKSLGLKKQWYKRSRKGDYSGLDTWKGWRRKDYQMQLYMDM